MTFAAGLAAEGLKPVVAIYSTFLQRAYDQLIHDVALQNLPVVFAIDRAGLVGGDGATHQGSYDISFMRCIPNLTVMTPADENECRQMLYTAQHAERPVRRALSARHGPGRAVSKEMSALPVGKGEIRREGRSGLALLAFGPLLDSALKIAERLDATVVNMRFVKPLDEALVLKVAARHRALITLEENVVAGGAGSAIGELLASDGVGHADDAYRYTGPLHRAWVAGRLPGRRRAGLRQRCRGGGALVELADPGAGRSRGLNGLSGSPQSPGG